MKRFISYFILTVFLGGLQYSAQAEIKISKDAKQKKVTSCVFQAKMKKISDSKKERDFIRRCESARGGNVPFTSAAQRYEND